MKKTWGKEQESKLLELRKSGKTFCEISEIMNKTESSIKHKIRRISQSNNESRHHHPREKIEQILSNICGEKLKILETNCGFGNLTEVYQKFGEVLSFDIDEEKIESVKRKHMEDVYPEKCDSIIEIHRLIYAKCNFDVIDIDPYGMPSRYFPHIFLLIKKGTMFVTLPKLGVQKLNKIMAEHLRCFYGIDETNRKNYIDIFLKKVRDFGMQSYREVIPVDIVSLGSIFRICLRVEKKSSLDLVGLSQKKSNPIPRNADENLLF